MFDIWGRRREISRTIKAIQEMADILERGKTGFVAAMMANADFTDDDPNAPSPEQLRRINYETLAACYMLHGAKKTAAQSDFYRMQALIADALCVMREVQKREYNDARSSFLRHYESWEPYLKSEDFVDKAMNVRGPL